MKVLMLRSNSVDPDPRVEKEAEALLKAGYSVDIFCWDRSSNHPIEQYAKNLESGNCEIYRVGIKSSYGAGFKKNLIPLMKFQLQIMRFIRKHYRAYDVLHLCDFDTAFSGFVSSRGKHLKLVYDIFDYYADAFSVPRSLKKMIVRLDSYVIDHVDGVIICSEQRKAQLRGASPKRLVVVHNSPGIEHTISSEKIEGQKDTLKIAYVGILNDGRLIPELLDVVSNKENYELHIGGFGKLEALVKEHVGQNIEFYGKTDYEQTLEIESGCDVMIATYDPTVSNHKYAAPNKFYEALMLGKPIIMCKRTGFSDVVEENGIGITIEYSKEALQDGLEYIKDNYDEFKSRRGQEIELYNKEYKWERMQARLIELYKSMQ